MILQDDVPALKIDSVASVTPNKDRPQVNYFLPFLF